MADAGAQGRPRRSLILAGGGVKVAFQAGALQVLLDEAGLEFDHVDGASGGSFNLAMLCQGMSGRRIADNWRRFKPLGIVQPNPKVLLGESIGRLERMRDYASSEWGIDWNAVRATELNATFNTYDFTRHELVVLEPRQMDGDLLKACVALPMWFPPVERDGSVLIDPVYITDANIDEAIRRGADELWIVWTVSRRGRWRRGFIHQYFQVIETAGNGHFKRALERIDASNAARAAGRHAEFDRHIDYKVLYGEVPLHYLLNVSNLQFRRAVEQGVEAARAWCRQEGIPLAPERPPAARPPSTMRFTETMSGHVALGEQDPERGLRAGRRAGTKLMFRLTMEIDDLDDFLANPRHQCPANGYVECAALGGRLPVRRGDFNLFTDSADAGLKHMRYRLLFADGQGRPLTLAGLKFIRDDAEADAWADTTTLYVRLLDGHVEEADEAGATVAGAGMIFIHPLAFARQLTTFRGSGPGPFGGLRAVLRFGAAFAGTLLEVYGLRLLRGG